MKIFIDSADVASIATWSKTGVIDGVTTNPTHLSKEGGDVTQKVLEICKLLPEGDISVEVTEVDKEAVYQQAKKIAALASNVVVKIPCHIDYYPVIARLVKEGVRINVTLVFSLTQALMMCKLGATYISPFVGRLEDSKVDGISLICDMRAMVDQYDYKTQILAASLRNLEHFTEAIMAGADVATLPLDVLQQGVEHQLTDAGMVRFAQDWQKLGIKQFP
jgi:transaldolase